MSQEHALCEAAERLVGMAQAAGADVAEVLGYFSDDLSVRVRLGETERVEQAVSQGLGLRVLKDQKSATAYSSDLSEAALRQLAIDTTELAELSVADPLSLPPDASELATVFPELELFDPATESVDAAHALKLAIRAEEAARAIDGVTNSEGADVSRSFGATAFVSSAGFSGSYPSSYTSLSLTAVADDTGGKMRTGSNWDARRFLSELADPEAIGTEAGLRAVRMRGAQKIPSSEMPVVFHPDAARALLSLLGSCLTGQAIFREESYLVGQLGEPVASEAVHVVDDALYLRGPGSRPFDGDGLASRKTALIEAGRLQSYLLDTYAARKLKMPSTASARRGLGGRPTSGPSNLMLLPGSQSAESLIAELSSGLYVTHMMGFGFNRVTGDFSRGAEGFLIENGQLSHPVSEITLASNFKALWRGIDHVADQLDVKSSVASPSFRVAKMAIAGL